jgi:hypothetical protein
MPAGMPADDSADYELLLPSQQSQPGKPATMGREEHQLKPEGRKGDGFAKYIALVRLVLSLVKGRQFDNVVYPDSCWGSFILGSLSGFRF